MSRLVVLLLALMLLPSLNSPAQAQMSTRAAAVCQPASYAFANAVVQLPGKGPILAKDVRRTIAVLGRQAFKANCTVTVVCVSADNSKPAFEAAKPTCKLARDVIASTQVDDSAAKKVILTDAKRPKDGYTPNSINLIFK